MMPLHRIYLLLVLIHICNLAAGQAGQLDTEFGDGNGIVQFAMPNQTHTQGSHIAVQPDGCLLILGSSWTPFKPEYAFLARFNDDGTMDSTFNSTGKIIFNPGQGDTYDGSVRVLANGQILVVNMASTLDGPEVHVHRFLPSGLPDPSFNDDGVFKLSLQAEYMNLKALAIQPDGKMIVAGYARFENNEIDHLTCFRLLANGDLDPGFHGDGISSFPVGESDLDARSILVQPDGKLIAAGYAVFGGEDDVILVRLLPDGSVDHSFGQQGIVRRSLSAKDDRCYAAALQQDGAIVLGCHIYNVVSGKTEFAAARFLPDGTPDPDFDDDGVKTITISGYADGLRSMALQPDGKILLAGYVHSDIPGGSDMAVVRLNTTGTLDMTFDEDGIAVLEFDDGTSTSLHHIALQTDGRIVGTGRGWEDGASFMYIARLLSGLTVSTIADQTKDLDFSLYPNPTSHQITVSFNLTAPAHISMCLYDLQGKQIRMLLPSSLRTSGKNEETLMLHGLTRGGYLLVVDSGQVRKSIPVMVQ